MVSSSSTSPVLRSPPCSPRFSRSLTRQLSPIPGSVRCRRSVGHRIAASAAACTSPERTRSPSSIASNSLYEILGISMGASNDEIKTAYRRLARICHPDVVASGAGEEFIRIHAAYSTLSDPAQRADYDRKLKRRRIGSLGSYDVVSASDTTSFRTYPWRNWETDQCW